MNLHSRWLPLALAGVALGILLLLPPAYPGHGWLAEFYENRYWQGSPRLTALVRDADFSLDGNRGSSRQVDFSVRYRAFISLSESGTYSFLLDSDDGSQLFVDERPVVNNLGIHVRRQAEGAVFLDAGEHQLRLDYFQGAGDSILRIRWRPPKEKGWSELPLERLTPQPAAEFDHTGCRRAAVWRLILFCTSLTAALSALVLWWRRLAGRLRMVFSREKFTALMGRPLAQDALCLVLCLPFYIHTLAVRYPHEAYLIGDSPYYANIAISLLHDLDLDQRNQTAVDQYPDHAAQQINMANSNIALGARGEWYPKHSLLLPLVSLPFYILGGGLGLLAFNFLQSLLLVVVFRRAAALFCRPGLSLAVAVVFGLAPLFRHYCYSYSADVLGSVLVLSGAIFLHRRRATAAGLLLCLACLAKLPNAFAVPPAAVALLIERRWRDLKKFSLGAAAVLVPFALLNWYMFGAPWLTGYSRVLVAEWGAVKIADHWSAFTRPFGEGFSWQLFDQSAGLLATAPLPCLGVLGLPYLWRSARGLALFIGLFFLATLAFYSPYDFLTVSQWGNRFIMPALSLLSLPLGRLFQAALEGISAEK